MPVLEDKISKSLKKILSNTEPLEHPTINLFTLIEEDFQCKFFSIIYSVFIPLRDYAPYLSYIFPLRVFHEGSYQDFFLNPNICSLGHPYLLIY